MAGGSAVRDEVAGAAAIVGRGLAATNGIVRDTHAAIAGRVFRLTGPPATPVRLMHNGITAGVYAAVGGGVRAVSYTAGLLGGTVAGRRAPGLVPAAERPGATVVLGALNGAWGDRFEQWRNPLTVELSVRVAGREVPIDTVSLGRAFPDASGDVVVFLHGLCETERSWRLGAEKHYGDRHSTHGSRLASTTGCTPVYLRYNSGLHISDNGARLAWLMSDLVQHWPVPVERLTLVGHSMGGLVIRSACAHAEESAWRTKVRRIVYLGAPHLGAPLEVAAATAGLALRRLPETAPLAAALASRSVGIKDLRYGDVGEMDWYDIEDPDARRAEPETCSELLRDVDHYYIGVTLTKSPDHPVAQLIGDALVTFPSASGQGKVRTLGRDVERGRHLGGLHHFDLLNHPRVYQLLESWLS